MNPSISQDNSLTTLLEAAFGGKSIWLSGHTGFKGSWLSHWLLDIGAEVHGFALPPAFPLSATPALFDQLDLARRLDHQIGDVGDAEAVSRSIQAAQPDFVFHLAAQAIVRTSFEQPVDTYTTNVLGAIHVAEALRTLRKPCAAVFVASDKCYENRESAQGYREEDPLGGFDPYSSSKAAAEIAVASWRRSFFVNHPVRIATGRAGNVIGGGDWARDRIVPDCMRALQQGRPIGLRNKFATRPWQHVLEPLSGYLWLADVLSRPSLRDQDPGVLASAFNFGPASEANRSVLDLVNEVFLHWPGSYEDQGDPEGVHEANLLSLSIDKAIDVLGWKPVWSFEKAISATVDWYRTAHNLAGAADAASELIELTSHQISDYQFDAAHMGLPWAAKCPRTGTTK